MKKIISVVFVFALALAQLSAQTQSPCQVLLPGISSAYTGGCKKGLAHGQGVADGIDHYEGFFKRGLPDGKGTYKWSTGEIYAGFWREGKRNGTGRYVFLDNGAEAVQDGNWVNDVYTGPVVPKPMVKYREGVDRYTFVNAGPERKRVLINIYQNGSRNAEISNLQVTSTSGYDTHLGQSFGYDGITFPVTIKLTYTTTNKLHTSTIYVRFEFEITEPGDWTVDITN